MIIDMIKTDLSSKMDKLEHDLPLRESNPMQSSSAESFGSQLTFMFQGTHEKPYTDNFDGDTCPDTVTYKVDIDDVAGKLVSWHTSFSDE